MQVFEANWVLGGRVFSIAIPELPYVADIGAMRFLPSQHIINALIGRLGVEDRKYAFKFATNRFVVRGRHLIAAAMTELRPGSGPDQPPVETAQEAFHFDPDERGMAPDSLAVKAIGAFLKSVRLDSTGDVDARCDIGVIHKKLERAPETIAGDEPEKAYFNILEPHEWTAVKRHGYCDDATRARVNTLSFWDVLQSGLSAEAFAFVRGTFGYQSILSAWNAAEAIPWFLSDLSGGGDYVSLKGGMSVLVAALMENLSKLGGWRRPQLGWILRAIRSESAATFRLTFDLIDTKDKVIARKDVLAREVILALPAGALSRLDVFLNDSGRASAHPHDALDVLSDSVAGHPLLKAFAFFPKPWWPPSDGSKGSKHESTRLFTDQVLRQVYFHGPDGCTAGEGQTGAMVMAYCDEHEANYWDALRKAGRHFYCTDPALREVLTSKTHSLVDRFKVPQYFWDRLRKALQDVHSLTREDGSKTSVLSEGVPPDARVVFYVNWGERPFYAGWHTWRVGTRAWATQAAARRPFKNRRLFVCGEALSSEQGWIEGALRSAEAMLQAELKLTAPKWLDQAFQTQRSPFGSVSEYVQW